VGTVAGTGSAECVSPRGAGWTARPGSAAGDGGGWGDPGVTMAGGPPCTAPSHEQPLSSVGGGGNESPRKEKRREWQK